MQSLPDSSSPKTVGFETVSTPGRINLGHCVSMYFGGAYFLYKDVFDRTPSLPELQSVLRDLNAVEAVRVLSQMNADLRLVKRERDTAAKLQQELASALFDDETVRRFKERFGPVHMGDRPVFHAPQVLNVIRLVVQHSVGSQDPATDTAARYKLGTACLMMNDLMVTAEEEAAIASSVPEEQRIRALMTQVLGPFEVVNTAAITHIAYRSRIMFHVLLNNPQVVDRIARECEGFDFAREFSRIIGISVEHWLFQVFGFYACLSHYVTPDGIRYPEFVVIDRTTFRGDSKITEFDFGVMLRTLSIKSADLKAMFNEPAPTDWRFDFTPFRARPLLEIMPDKFVCPDIGFLVEKMHSGVFWALFDGLSREERWKLFKAWGILFEEYVNWFLAMRAFEFKPRPQWADGTECFDGAITADARFMPMEYKGGFLKVAARYSGTPVPFEADLELKIAEGCEQLARKIESLFTASPISRKELRDIPLTAITRVIPVLVVQDHILRGPLVNWLLNNKFNERLDRSQLRPGVTVDSLNVVGIHELETMAESTEDGKFDIFHGLQLRCFRDPEMRSELHNFLMMIPAYGEGKSARVESILEDQWQKMEQYMFGTSDEAVSAI